jgi:hypothetical protein
MWTVMIMAFINGNIFFFFPGKECFHAVGAKIFSGFAKTDMKLKDI